jgi:CheY-like chemotaxis protein
MDRPVQVFPRPISGIRPIPELRMTRYLKGNVEQPCHCHAGTIIPMLDAPPLSDPHSAMTLKILLVDDNRTFVATVRQFLDSLADVVIIGQAHDGKSALALVRQHRPELVLLDIAMPGMNGLELARAMQLDPVAPQIVFLSIHDNQEYRHAARELGADFVSKADFVSELLPLLDELTQIHNNREAATLADRTPEGPQA